MDVLELFRNSQNARRLAAGETVFRQGAPGDVMYVLTEGEVAITLVQLSPLHKSYKFRLLVLGEAFQRSLASALRMSVSAPSSGFLKARSATAALTWLSR